MKKEDILNYDIRLHKRNLRHGIINKKELNKYLKSLPDVSDKAQKLGEETEKETETAAEEEEGEQS